MKAENRTRIIDAMAQAVAAEYPDAANQPSREYFEMRLNEWERTLASAGFVIAEVVPS